MEHQTQRKSHVVREDTVRSLCRVGSHLRLDSDSVVGSKKGTFNFGNLWDAEGRPPAKKGDPQRIQGEIANWPVSGGLVKIVATQSFENVLWTPPEDPFQRF